MILADVNVLVYAFDEASIHHSAYARWLQAALVSDESFALVDTVLSGFVRIVTHPKIFDAPATAGQALEFVRAVIDSPATQWLKPTGAVWLELGRLTEDDTALRGNLVPDAYLASVAMTHGARLATADRGFGRYRGLRFFDPGKT